MGNYALILSCAKPDDLILLASDCHISAVHAALLAHYRISLISCDQTAQGLPQPMSYQKAAEALSSHPEAKALVMTSPNYYGFCADIPAIAALCHEKNVALLVDAAHGAHFGFSPLLPIQPVDADGWVVSAHKTLYVSNQGSLIFRGKKSKLDAFRLENNVHRFQSTSPVSYTHLELAEKYNLCVVLPSGENSFYMNREDRFECWENFFCQELPLLMQRAFPLSDRREDTFIGGFSMGGFGALRNGLKHYDRYGKIFCFAPALELEYTCLLYTSRCV